MWRAHKTLERQADEVLFTAVLLLKALHCTALHSMAVRRRIVNTLRLNGSSEGVLEFQSNEKGFSIYISHPFGSESSVGGNCSIRGEECRSDLRRAPTGRD